ncbi:MAG: hypothetical protein K0U20_09005 [Proteobacteria bacterium]|nr:hypothetical protein [Pseudomonadota bacterium]
MSTTYNTVDGDTFEKIARIKYGSEQNANLIAKSNPGVTEPLTPGTVIVIPNAPGTPNNLQQQTNANSDNQTAILINGLRFKFWDKVRITRSIDNIDTVEFSAPFDVNIPNFKTVFRPFSYQDVIVTVGDNPLFTGTMLTPVPVVENKQKIITVSCYSRPGRLNDCTAPASAYPLEFNGQGLQEIANTLTAPFGIPVIFKANQGAIFERVASDPGEKILAFLIKLTKQRNLILASDPLGNLIVWQSIETGSPVAVLKQGSSPVLSVSPFFSPQEYYSHITGIEPVIVGLAGSQFTVKNARLTGVMRPLTFNAPDTIDSTVKSAVEAKAGRMFGNIVSYSVRLNTWRDPAGNLWEPNTTIKLVAPDAMIYNNYEFIIRSVEFNRDNKTETATLNLVLPGSFSGKIPNTLPWDD